MIRWLGVLATTTLLAAACGSTAKKDQSIRSKSGAQATSDTAALWRFAPKKLKFGVVVAQGSMGKIRSQASRIRADIESVAGGTEVMRDADTAIQELLSEFGLGPLDKLREQGLSLELGGAHFWTEDETVSVLPVSNREAFVASMNGTTENGVDTIRPDFLCKEIAEHYLCASTPEALASVERSESVAADVDVASWPATERGDLEAFVPAHLFDELGLDSLLSKREGMRLAVQIRKGELELRAHVLGTPVDLAAVSIPTSSPLVDELLSAPSSGVLMLRLAGLWSVFAPQFIPQVPDQDVMPGVNPAALLRSLQGDLVASTPSGKAAAGVAKIALRDEAAFRRLIDHCDSLGTPLPGALSFALRDGRCFALLSNNGVELEIEVAVEANTLLLSVAGEEPQAHDTKPSGEVHPVAKTIVAENWNFVAWGFGSMSRFASNLSELFRVDPSVTSSNVSIALWAAFHLNELGLGLRVADDGAHLWLKFRTTWSNPDEVLDRLEPALNAFARGSAEASSELSAIETQFPRSPWAVDSRDGGGGMLVASSVGILASVAIPAFIKYMKKSKTAEAVHNVQRIHAEAYRLAQQGKLPPSAPLTPPITAGCAYGGSEKFSVEEGDWEHPTWKALGFSMTDEHYYAYEFVNEGDTFSVFGYGDLDCDGAYSRFIITETAVPGQAMVGRVLQQDALE